MLITVSNSVTLYLNQALVFNLKVIGRDIIGVYSSITTHIKISTSSSHNTTSSPPPHRHTPIHDTHYPIVLYDNDFIGHYACIKHSDYKPIYICSSYDNRAFQSSCRAVDTYSTVGERNDHVPVSEDGLISEQNNSREERQIVTCSSRTTTIKALNGFWIVRVNKKGRGCGHLSKFCFIGDLHRNCLI